MLRKQKKKKGQTKEKKSSICKIPREINTVKISTQLLPVGHFKSFFSNQLRKARDTLTVLNFINSAKSSAV